MTSKQQHEMNEFRQDSLDYLARHRARLEKNPAEAVVTMLAEMRAAHGVIASMYPRKVYQELFAQLIEGFRMDAEEMWRRRNK